VINTVKKVFSAIQAVAYALSRGKGVGMYIRLIPLRKHKRGKIEEKVMPKEGQCFIFILNKEKMNKILLV